MARVLTVGTLLGQNVWVQNLSAEVNGSGDLVLELRREAKERV